MMLRCNKCKKKIDTKIKSGMRPNNDHCTGNPNNRCGGTFKIYKEIRE